MSNCSIVGCCTLSAVNASLKGAIQGLVRDALVTTYPFEGSTIVMVQFSPLPWTAFHRHERSSSKQVIHGEFGPSAKKLGLASATELLDDPRPPASTKTLPVPRGKTVWCAY